jgi:hypothetical protein
MPIAYNPHPDGRRYGIGEWRDIVDGDGNAVQLSSQGKFGFSPWIDNQRGYLGVFLVEDLLFPDLYPVVDLLQAIIRTELDTFDADGDGAQDSSDTDDDNDGLSDSFERACGTASADAASSMPERSDGPFAGVDDDGDGGIDELLPGYSEAFDCDGDGWTGAQEKLIFSAGTTANDQDPCGNNGWPADTDPGNVLDIGDINSFTTPAGANDGHGTFNYFGHTVPDAGRVNEERWDLSPGDAVIDIGDLNAISPAVTAPTARPPMFGGQPAFFTNSGQCPYPP